MKTLITCCIAALISVNLTFAGIKVTSKVTFGAHSKGCSGFGVCKSETSTQSGALPTTWEFNGEKGVLTLRVSEEELEGQVTNNTFTQQEAFPLPDDLSRQLGAPEPLVIPAGHYPARLADGRYIITFSLQE